MSPAQQSFTQAANSSFTPPNVASDAYSNLGTQGANMLPQPPPTNFADVNQIASQGFGPPAAPPVAPPANAPFTAYPPEGGIPPEFNAYTSPLPTAAPTSALEKGMNTAVEFAKKNPFTALAGTTMVAQKLGLFNPSGATFNQQNYSGPLSKYKLSPDFKGTNVNPANFQYNPKGYAGGGIMNANQMNPNSIAVGYDGGGDIPQYAKGGSLTDSIEQYQKMLSGAPQTIPDTKTDVGIFHDTDPDTRYQDALTAAQIRQSKINQRAYVSPPVAKRPTPMGQLQMASVKPRKQGGADDVEAAQGGVMHASLGGYAAGGNPRLLQGPGDGMSDNIPATINGRQPARLADGEFVIPADVVSHLGNGSTEAGAKQLHAMMDKVRSARTGNSKQGKQINPKKYMPK
jgi:hypothetical protein